LKLNAISLSFTVAGIVFVLSALAAVVVVPVLLNYLYLSNFSDLLIRIARWPAMFVAVAIALACVYRFGPSREAPHWHWITWGSAAATSFGFQLPVFFRGARQTSVRSTRRTAPWLP
jgi:membrane protein